MKRQIIPYSYLFLYCKGWLRFPDSKGFVDDMRRVIKLDNYIANSNPTLQVLNGFNQIKEYFESNGIKLSTEWNHFGYFYECSLVRSYSEKSVKIDNKEISPIEIGMMRKVYGCIQMLKSYDFVAVKFIDYNIFKLRTASWKPGETYKTSQWKFNKAWNDKLIEQSYDVPWYIKHNYKI